MKRRKLIYIICLLGVVLLNIFYVNYEFYLLLLLLVLIPLFSFVLFMIAKRKVELYFRMPSKMLWHKDKIRAQIMMVNHAPVLLANSEVGFSIACTNVPTKKYKKRTMHTFYDSYKESISIETLHCGIYTIQAENVEMYDYLGLFCKKKRFQGSSEIAVFPQLLPTEEKDNEELLRGREISHEEWTILDGDSDEIVDMRTYQDGDSMNKIHWKLSVKMDDLIVKKYGDVEDKVIRILVDLSLTEDGQFRDHLDKIYQMAYSIGNFYVRNEIKACFIFWDEERMSLVQYPFDNRQELNQGMVLLMRQICTENAGGRTEAAFRDSHLRLAEKPYWITAQDFERRDYEVINVAKGYLEEMMETLYQGEK